MRALGEEARRSARMCKVDYAANVKMILPRGGRAQALVAANVSPTQPYRSHVLTGCRPRLVDIVIGWA